MGTTKSTRKPGDKKRRTKQETHPGKLPKLWDFLSLLHTKSPEVFRTPDLIRQEVARVWPAIKDPSTCANCGSNMQIGIVTASVFHAILLLEMAKAVREEIRKGVPFTEANRIHIDRLSIATSIKKQQSNAGYLNLIVQPKGTKSSGYWTITTRGWAALRGDPIARSVKHWRKEIIERSQETTTLGEMMRTYNDKIAEQIRYGRAVKQGDHRRHTDAYDPIEWAEYDSKSHEGPLL